MTSPFMLSPEWTIHFAQSARMRAEDAASVEMIHLYTSMFATLGSGRDVLTLAAAFEGAARAVRAWVRLDFVRAKAAEPDTTCPSEGNTPRLMVILRG